MKELQPWQARLMAESAELDERIKKLIIFIGDSAIYEALSDVERMDLGLQLSAMIMYNTILTHRISLL